MPSQASLKKFAARAKAHHQSVNAAFAHYYGVSPAPSPSASTSSTPRASMSNSRQSSTVSSSNSARSTSSTSSFKSAWKSFMHNAKEHHRSMNDAYIAYYGIKAGPTVHARA